MFAYCRKFNQPIIIIPVSVTDCEAMFCNCHRFNQQVTIPPSVTNCNYMFAKCFRLNKPVTISSAIECYRMFSECDEFNQQIVLPNSIKIVAICLNTVKLLTNQ